MRAVLATPGLRRAAYFEVAGCRLHGMLDLPPAEAVPRSVGIVMLHSDDGCRLGPHGLWVRLAERLRGEGFPCLRFDYRGCGDSEGPEGPPTGDAGVTDTLAAETFVRQQTGVMKTLLIGICFGAEVALLASRCLPTTIGVVACSTGRYISTAGSSKTLEYVTDYARSYARKLLMTASWRKLVRGQVSGRAILDGFVDRLRPAARRRDRAAAVRAQHLVAGNDHCSPSLFIYGSRDPLAARYMPGYQEEAAVGGFRRSFCTIQGADHNFSSLRWSQELIDASMDFVASCSS